MSIGTVVGATVGIFLGTLLCVVIAVLVYKLQSREKARRRRRGIANARRQGISVRDTDGATSSMSSGDSDSGHRAQATQLEAGTTTSGNGTHSASHGAVVPGQPSPPAVTVTATGAATQAALAQLAPAALVPSSRPIIQLKISRKLLRSVAKQKQPGVLVFDDDHDALPVAASSGSERGTRRTKKRGGELRVTRLASDSLADSNSDAVARGSRRRSRSKRLGDVVLRKRHEDDGSTARADEFNLKTPAGHEFTQAAVAGGLISRRYHNRHRRSGSSSVARRHHQRTRSRHQHARRRRERDSESAGTGNPVPSDSETVAASVSSNASLYSSLFSKLQAAIQRVGHSDRSGHHPGVGSPHAERAAGTFSNLMSMFRPRGLPPQQSTAGGGRDAYTPSNITDPVLGIGPLDWRASYRPPAFAEPDDSEIVPEFPPPQLVVQQPGRVTVGDVHYAFVPVEHADIPVVPAAPPAAESFVPRRLTSISNKSPRRRVQVGDQVKISTSTHHVL